MCLSTRLVYNACQLSSVRLPGKPGDGWQMRTLAAFTTCSSWCQPLGAAQFIGSEKPRQAEPTAVSLCHVFRSKQRPGDLFRELPAAVHSSLLLNWSRVAFLHYEVERIRPSPIIRGSGSEGGKSQVVFLPLFKWKRLASEADSSAACIHYTQETVQKCQVLLRQSSKLLANMLPLLQKSCLFMELFCSANLKKNNLLWN